MNLADVQLRLGDIPAEYGVMATCPDCIPSASTVTFKCCGKLKNDDFKQFDSRWKSEHYDNLCSSEPANSGRYRPVYNCSHPVFQTKTKYKFSIGAKGCALTALATLINHYNDAYNLPVSSTTPKDLNTFFKGKAGCYTDTGGLYFGCVEEYSESIKYQTEYFNITKKITRNDLIIRATQDILDGYPVILFISNSSHFILAIGKCGDKFIVSDPGTSNLKKVLYDPRGSRALKGIRRFKYAD